eukprot:TRINITY_DN398_c0_g1_i1.p3 TRINITY_DN398_c0_g1~~TRINITY_DN398_c0_g1_i1.p3  ORF type:complete len:117 (+),score=10.70 TRINITY_DN398_c0_g1_i1:2260-2610(+)
MCIATSMARTHRVQPTPESVSASLDVLNACTRKKGQRREQHFAKEHHTLPTNNARSRQQPLLSYAPQLANSEFVEARVLIANSTCTYHQLRPTQCSNKSSSAFLENLFHVRKKSKQ